MILLNFINQNQNWKEILSNPPYNILIKEDGPYILLKYNQLESDFNEHVVQECRGCIIKQFDDGYSYVCRPFDKFFNYGEEQAADIDWNSSFITEKIDGSLMKLWFDDGWHISTNGTIDAFKAIVTGNEEYSFGDIFLKASKCCTIFDFCKDFDKQYTYLFELTSPETKVVINYDYAVWYLAKRNTITGKYAKEKERVPKEILQAAEKYNIQFPKVYPLHSLSEIINIVNQMSKDEEGVVVSDDYGNRIKVKSPEYLIKAKLIGNGTKSDEVLLEIIFNGQEDDLLAYCPEYTERINEIKNRIELYIDKCKSLWEQYKGLVASRKEFAQAIVNFREKSYLFAKADGKLNGPIDYLKRITITNAVKLLNNYPSGSFEHT